MKKEDIIDDADDKYEVRTSASQNGVLATLCTEKFLLRTNSPLITADGKLYTYRRSQLGFSSQLDLHTTEWGLQNLYKCDWGRVKRSIFYFTTICTLIPFLCCDLPIAILT